MKQQAEYVFILHDKERNMTKGRTIPVVWRQVEHTVCLENESIIYRPGGIIYKQVYKYLQSNKGLVSEYSKNSKVNGKKKKDLSNKKQCNQKMGQRHKQTFYGRGYIGGKQAHEKND